VCHICRNKSAELAELASYFRDKASQTNSEYYQDIMNETAESLEDLSRYFTERCRAGEPADRYDAAIRPHKGRLLWPLPTRSGLAMPGAGASSAHRAG